MTNTQQTTADYLQLATQYIAWAAQLHLKYYSFRFMPPKASGTERVHWTPEETTAIVDFLHAHQSEGEGGSFKKQTYHAALQHIVPLHKKGGPKSFNSVKDKFRSVSHGICFQSLNT